MVVGSVKGVPTLTSGQSAMLRRVERCAISAAESFGYRELRLPVLERSDLFKRSVGADTDIVEKEMYEFPDSKGELICLRPEGTAGCVAACIRQGLIARGQRQRVWYSGPFFRRERPQQGRYRQFHQVGVEAFGFTGADIDAELLMMVDFLWEKLGLRDAFTLQINSLGSLEARTAYRRDLLAYFIENEDKLDEVSRNRMRDNPLRVLDSKDAGTRRVAERAPTIGNYLDDHSRAEFEQLKTVLDDEGIEFRENQRLVRGLDYYTGMVFEWVTPDDKSQNTVCAGGRYDSLVELLGGERTSAVGFAIGCERVAAVLSARKETDRFDGGRTVYVVTVGEDAVYAGRKLSRKLRRVLPAWAVIEDCVGGTLKSRMKRAGKCGCDYVLIMGDDELSQGKVNVKHMSDGRQDMVAMDELAAFLKHLSLS